MSSPLNLWFKIKDLVLACCRNFPIVRHYKKLMNQKAIPNQMYIPTDYEHCANTLSHALMIIPSILLSEILLWKTGILYPSHKNFWNCDEKICIYGNDSSQPTYAAYEFCSRAYSASLIGLFLISSIYHWISWTQSCWKKNEFSGCSVRRPSLRKVFHICDRTTIYFFIAGSYSPWLMLHEIHPKLQWMQWAIWLVAILGTSYSFIFLEKYKLLETIFYVFVGVVPGVTAYYFSIDSAEHENPFPELAFGGAFYLIGVLFFKCDGIIPFAHAIWHLFVAAGAFSHFVTIYKHFYI